MSVPGKAVYKPIYNHDTGNKERLRKADVSGMDFVNDWVTSIQKQLINGGFLCRRATPSHHPFHGIFPFTKTVQRTWGTSILGTPKPIIINHYYAHIIRILTIY